MMPTLKARYKLARERGAIGFGDSSLDFELRAWTESSDALTIVRSDLTVGVQDALAAAGIEVPFPQRDLHVKTLPEQPGKAKANE